MERKLGSILIEEVMATLEQIIDEARALSPAEKGKLRQALDRELEQLAPDQPLKPGYPTNEQERAWINAHRDEYLGQWVALDGDHLVAHGTDAKNVYDEAREQGITAPYLVHVTPKVEAYVGGW
jgi:predicted Zn-dependent protease